MLPDIYSESDFLYERERVERMSEYTCCLLRDTVELNNGERLETRPNYVIKTP